MRSLNIISVTSAGIFTGVYDLTSIGSITTTGTGTGLGVAYLAATSVMISVVISLMIIFSGSLFSKSLILPFISAYYLAKYSIAYLRLSNE